MSEYADNEILLYDLSNRPASFDFVTCLSTAVTHGVKHVRFVIDQGWKKKDYDNPEERFWNIVEPAVALYGLTYSIGERKGTEYLHILKTALDTYHHFGRLAKIPVRCDPQSYVTVTLRKSRCPERDSKDHEWVEFAERCGRKALILRDYSERPLLLEDRMQLYAGAYMNLMVINGPLTLCLHSDAPFICMRTIGADKSGSTSPQQITRLTGITQGFQYPWMGENQHLSYLDDTADNIMAEYKMMERRLLERKAA